MLILASSSPRRHELLKMVGLSFEVEYPDISEDIPFTKPDEMVKTLAEKKARAVADVKSEGLVIGSDTLVFCDGDILGKPKNKEHAVSMLLKLQGNVHYVYSGVAIVDAKTKKSAVDYRRTKVIFKPMNLDEINAYIEAEKPFDKAGAYGIQGRAAVFIEGIEGCYYNVIGLPLACLFSMLKEFDCNLVKSIFKGK
ncbi:Maf family protein [Peptococcaceae bacterium]|nr:Maf family protein [Peptococcaceae bacterium]